MIYFVDINRDGPIKIGFTKRDVGERIKELQTSCPYQLNLLATMEGDIFREKRLQRSYQNWKLPGNHQEWYEREPLIQFIDKIREKPH